MNRRSWLEIAEYASLACFVAGSIAALASQQMALAAVPLTLALALNLVNRHRFEQQTRLSGRSTVADVNQVVQSLNEANAELTQKTETLAQLFHSRPELEQIEGLKQAIAALPPPPKIDREPDYPVARTAGAEDRDAGSTVQRPTRNRSNCTAHSPAERPSATVQQSA